MALVSGIQYSSEITSRKNLIINGNFDIWQRGTSFAAVANAEYTADRIQHGLSGTMVFTVSQSTDVPTYNESGVNSKYSILADCTTADTSIASGDLFTIQNSIEGYDYAQLANGNATLSFWVKATKTGTYCVSFRSMSGLRSYVTEYTVDVSDTWEKKIINVALTGDEGGSPALWDYTNQTGLIISWALAAGSNYQTTADTWATGNYIGTSNQVNACDSTANNFYLSQIQFEQGTVATDFEKRHIGEELALCERYYQKVDSLLYEGDVTSGQSYDTVMSLRTTMRATGSAVMTNLGASRFPTTASTPWLIGPDSIATQRIANSTGAAGYYYESGFIDAEL